MPDDAATEVRWPDRFVYLCTAGAGAQVNIAPMLHAGADRVVAVVIMVPVADPANPTAEEKAQAIIPADRIFSYATRVLNLATARVRRISGHPDLLSADWARSSRVATDLARELNAEVVFNVSSGRKQATLGALLEMMRRPEPKVTLLTVGSSEFVVRGITLGADGKIAESVLPVEATQQLGPYLTSYGFREIGCERRTRHQEWIEAQHNLVGAIRSLGYRTQQKVFGHFNRTVSTKRLNAPCEIPISTEIEGHMADIATMIDGCSVAHGQLRVESEDGLKFLTGGWFEAEVYTAVREVLLPTGAILAANVELTAAKRKRDGFDPAEVEFDVVVLGNDRLDLIEAKSTMDPKGLHGVIDKLAKYRTQLSGPAGVVWLVAPFHNQASLERLGLIEHAKHEGVRFFYGADAVAQMVAQLKERRSPRR